MMTGQRLVVAVICLAVSAGSLCIAFSGGFAPIGRSGLQIDAAGQDLGSVRQGSIVNTQLTVRNRGKSNITVERLVASCGCTSSDFRSQIIAPGDILTIPVKWDVHGRRHQSVVDGVLDCQYSSGEPFKVPFRLQAYVEPTFVWSPERPVVQRDSATITEVVIRRGPAWDAGAVRRVETTHSCLNAVLDGSADLPDDSSVILLNLDASAGKPVGQVKLIVYTTSDSERMISIPVEIEW